MIKSERFAHTTGYPLSAVDYQLKIGSIFGRDVLIFEYLAEAGIIGGGVFLVAHEVNKLRHELRRLAVFHANEHIFYLPRGLGYYFCNEQIVRRVRRAWEYGYADIELGHRDGVEII